MREYELALRIFNKHAATRTVENGYDALTWLFSTRLELADCTLRAGNLTEALSVSQALLEEATVTLGAEHDETGRIKRQYASALSDLSRNTESQIGRAHV